MILAISTPLQIISPIVSFYPIFMVNARLFFWVRDECHRHEPMYKLCFAFLF